MDAKKKEGKNSNIKAFEKGIAPLVRKFTKDVKDEGARNDIIIVDVAIKIIKQVMEKEN